MLIFKSLLEVLKADGGLETCLELLRGVLKLVEATGWLAGYLQMHNFERNVHTLTPVLMRLVLAGELQNCLTSLLIPVQTAERLESCLGQVLTVTSSPPELLALLSSILTVAISPCGFLARVKPLLELLML